MAGNYLKSLQLAKQLEERAREATRNKEKAEEDYETLQKFLETCRENDTDLSEVERIISEFNASINSKDYQAAIAQVRKATEEAKASFLKKIGDVADSADGLLNLAQIPASEAKGALELLEKSKEQVLKDDLDGAMKSAKSAYDASERALHEYFSALLSQAQEVMMQAKEIGDDISLFEELLKKAKGSLQKQEYESGLTQLKEVLEGAGENVKSQVNAAIDTAQDLVSAGDELKVDTSKMKANIDRAEKALESLRFKEALAYAKRAESEGENAIASKFHDIAREVKDGIRKLEAVDQDISVPQDLLEEAQKAMKEKKFIEALRAIGMAQERIGDMQFNSVLAVISRAKDKFVLAKKVGVDMTKPIMLLNTARDNLRLKKFEDAVRYAEESSKEIDESLGVFYSARDHLVELTTTMRFASDLGVEIESLKVSLAQAKKAFESKEYAKTTEIAKQGVSDARKASYDKTMDTVDGADRAVKLGKTIGADVSEAEGVLQGALASLSKEDLPESVKLARSALEAANSAMTRILSDRLQNLDEFVKGFSGEENLSEVSDLIVESRTRLSEQSFERTHELLKDVQRKIENAGQEESDRLLTKAIDRVEHLKAMGGNADDLEILITRVKESISKKVFEEASARAKEIIQSANDMSISLIQAEFSGIKDTIEEAKAVGIEIESVKNSVKEARARFDSKDYDAAHSLLRETRSQLSSKIARFDGIKDKIMKAESMIAEAKASKVDLPKEIEDLDRAKSKFEEGDFEASEKLLDEVMDRTEKKLAMYLAAKIILTAKESIELAEAHDIDLAEGQQLLVKTKELMKKKDYEEALETAKRCEELVSSTMQNAVGEQITDLRRLITDAKNVGIDTSGPEILAEKAASLVEEADYPEVLRCIDAARNDIDQIKNLSSQAAIEIKSARTRLKDAEALDMEVGKASEFLDQAIEALTRHQYAIALELSRKSSDASSEITKTTIWDTLQKFKDRVDRAASDGTTVGVAERCVSEGVEAFNEGRYQDALRLAMKCEAEIDRVELQREISTKAVEMATKKLNDAMNEGIVVDAVRESVQEATQLLSQGKYVDALSKALESGDRLHQVRERLDSTRIEMSSVKEQVERLKKVGIDTTGCDELLSVAQQQLSKHQFSQSKETLSKCSQTAMEVFERSINDVMEQNKELISRAKMMGLNTKPCEDLMHVAQTSFSEKLWDFAYQQAQACRTTGIDIISKKIDKLALESTERLGPLKALGASVSVVEELIEQARGAVANGDASEAFQILMEADQRILGIEDSHKKYADISIAAESAIETLKRIGVSTSESERLLALADLEREKDYDSAIEFVAEALDSAKTAIDSYAPEITGSVSSSDLQEGSEGEIEIALKNTGNVVGRDLSIELSGQFKVLEVPSIASLRPGAELKIKAKIVPEKSGDLSIRVSTECKRQFDGAPQSFVFEDILSVFRSGPPFKLTRATEVAKCANCQGKIKQGFDIVSCRCGSQLHLACAKRTAKCPVCGQTYTF